MIAPARGPALALSASHTRVPGAVAASSAARLASSASSSLPTGSTTMGSSLIGRSFRRSGLPAVQRLQRAEAAAVLVGQVPRLHGVAHDGRREQDHGLLAPGL